MKQKCSFVIVLGILLGLLVIAGLPPGTLPDSYALVGPIPGPNIGDMADIPLLHYANAIAVIDADTMLVADNLKLYSLDIHTRAVTLVATLPVSPADIAVEGGGASALILNSRPGQNWWEINWEIRRVNLGTGEHIVLADGFSRPHDMAIENSGSALVSDDYGIWRANLSTGEITQLAAVGVGNVGGIAMEPGKNSAVFTLRGTFEVDRINLTDNTVNKVTTDVLIDGTAWNDVGAIAVSKDGSFAVFTAGIQAGIARIDLATGVVRRVFYIPDGSVVLGGYSIIDLALAPDDSSVRMAWSTPEGIKISEVLLPDPYGCLWCSTDITWGINPRWVLPEDGRFNTQNNSGRTALVLHAT